MVTTAPPPAPERSRACVGSLLPCVWAPQHREGPTECPCHNRYKKAAQLPLLLRYPRPAADPLPEGRGRSRLPEMGGHVMAVCQGLLG